MSDSCSAFVYNSNDESCEFGHVAPHHLECNSSHIVYVEGSLFSTAKQENPLWQVTWLQSHTNEHEKSYPLNKPFGAEINPPSPNNFNGTSANFYTGHDYNIFNGPGSLIYICKQTAPRNCKRWDYITGEWSDPPDPNGPSVDHLHQDPLQGGDPTTAAAICTLDDGKVIMSGGFNDVNDVMNVDGSWTTTEFLEQATHSHACAPLSSSKFMILGGHDGTNPLATTYIFDLDTNTRTLKAPMSMARVGPAAGTITTSQGRQRVIVAGYVFGDSVAFYDVASDSWEDTGHALFGGYSLARTIENQFYFIGGYTSTGGGSLKAYRYNERADNFERLPGLTPVASHHKYWHGVITKKTYTRKKC